MSDNDDLTPEQKAEFKAVLGRISAKVRDGLISDEQIEMVQRRIKSELEALEVEP